MDVDVSFYYFRTFDKDEVDLVIESDGNISLVKLKSGETYKKDDIKAFDLFKSAKHRRTKNAIVCTTHAIYSIGEDCYVLHVSSI